MKESALKALERWLQYESMDRAELGPVMRAELRGSLLKVVQAVMKDLEPDPTEATGAMAIILDLAVLVSKAGGTAILIDSWPVYDALRADAEVLKRYDVALMVPTALEFNFNGVLVNVRR